MVDIKDETSGVGADDFADESPNGEAQYEGWETIWNAPDYASFVKVRESRRAKEYKTRVNSVLKSATLMSINAGDFPDAAALLHYGPPFAAATGRLADQNAKVAAAVEMLTAPDSPWLAFGLTAIALSAQIVRNHEAQIKEIPNARKRAKAIKKAEKASVKDSPPRFTIRVLGRSFPVRFRSRIQFKALFAGFRAQTQAPQELTMRVFSDPDLINNLEKLGYTLVRNDGNSQP